MRKDRALPQNLKGGDKKVVAEVECLERIKEALYNDLPARSIDLSDDEKLLVRDLHLLTMKPILYAANVSEDEVSTADENPFVKIVKEYAEKENNEVVSISAKVESEIAELEEEEKRCSSKSWDFKSPA